MRLLQDIIAINLEGIRLLGSKDAIGALHSFELAVALLKRVADDQVNNVSSFAADWQDWGGQQTERLRLSDPLCFQSDICWIFDRLVIVPTDSKLDTREELDSFVHLTGTAIMFNYALACHVHGTLCGSDFVQEKAACLYKLTLKMIESAMSTSDDNATKHFCVVRCAALNNLTHILYLHCAYEHCATVMDALCDAIMSAVESLHGYLCETEMHNVMLNKFYMLPPLAAQAA
jgi:hypothetical protein